MEKIDNGVPGKFNLHIHQMRRIFLILLFFSSHNYAYNQIIRGTVFDIETKSNISYASIYFNGSVIGTTTNNNGNFELDISKNRSMPLTVSAIGYFSVTITDLSSVKSYDIYLRPKVFELKEVVVNSNSNERGRKANMRIFKDEFLGTTDNAQNCEILNENDIRFLYDSDDKILRAYALKPILIDNKALGYKITYFLDKFQYSKNTKTFSFSGNISFKEDSLLKITEQMLINRRLSYVGSRMHFFRALWSNNLSSEGFKIKNSLNKDLSYKDLVLVKDSVKLILSSTPNLTISFSLINVSEMVLLKKSILFDKNGYFDPMAFSWEGEMARQRIADLLPIEYSVK